MIALKNVNRRSMIDFEDLLFMLVEKKEDAELDQFYYVDAIIINSMDNQVFESILNGVRNHHNSNIYLKPIFALPQKGVSNVHIQSCDDITDMVQYQPIAKRTRAINARIEKLFAIQRFPSPEMEFLFKTLQFVFTREEPLKAIPNRFSRINYHFPFLSRLIKDEDSLQILRVLEKAAYQGYLSPEPVDKVHLCDNCGSAHHNIRETCINCGGIDLKTEDLIHHFQCAYVGPERDFFPHEHSDQMNCPKCEKKVRHIGIDYDKPSQIYQCKSCNHNFQEARFTYHCVECSEVKDIQHLQEHAISQMTLTSKGTRLMLKGLPQSNNNPQSVVKENQITGIYTYDVFQHLIRQEELRTRHNGHSSVLGHVELSEGEVNKLSRYELGQVQTELCKVLKGYVKETDMISTKSPAHYYFLLTDSDIKRAREMKATVEYNFKQLLEGNFQDIPIDVEVHLQVLGEQQAQLPDQEMN